MDRWMDREMSILQMDRHRDERTERQRKRQTWPNRRDRKMEIQRDRHSVTERQREGDKI
jgi:hypothetical protein